MCCDLESVSIGAFVYMKDITTMSVFTDKDPTTVLNNPSVLFTWKNFRVRKGDVLILLKKVEHPHHKGFHLEFLTRLGKLSYFANSDWWKLKFGCHC